MRARPRATGPTSSTLDVHIHWLRQRIEDDPTRPLFVHTIRQHGYRFQPNPPSSPERAIFLADEPIEVVAPSISRDFISRVSREHARV